MRTVSTVAAFVAMMAVSSAALAQADATPAILKKIPAGAAGFVVAPSVQKAGANADAFMQAIGLKDMLGEGFPGSIEFIRTQTKLGEGFDATGSFAAVMLDPQAFGFDPLAGMGGPSTAPSGPPPLVIYVPGKDIQSVFGNYQIADAGKFKVVSLRMGNVFAVEKDGHILLSPNDKALAAAAAPAKTADGELSKDALKQIAGGDVAVHVNMKVVGPLYIRMMERATSMPAGAPDGGASFAGIMKLAIDYYKTILPQMDAVTMSMRLGKSAVIVDEVVAFAPGSQVGKMLAAYKGADAKGLLDNVPNLSYVLAIGTVGVPKEAIDSVASFMDDVLKMPELSDLSAETKAKAKAVVVGLNEQTMGAQMVIGDAPQGSGEVGFAYLIKCKDPAKVQALMADGAAVAQDSIIQLSKGEMKDLKIAYEKGVETVGGVKVDAITVAHPEMAKMPEDARKSMKAVLGDDRIRFLVAASGTDTVVVTFGGGAAMMDKALAAASKGGSGILTGTEATEALAAMPPKPVMVGALSPKNLVTMIKSIAAAAEPGSQPPPVEFNTSAPIIFAEAVADGSVTMTLYVPNAVVSEAISLFSRLASSAGVPGPTEPAAEPARPMPRPMPR